VAVGPSIVKIARPRGTCQPFFDIFFLPPVCAAVSRSLIQLEDSEWPVHVPAGPVGGFGGVVASGLVQGADGKVPEGSYALGPDPRSGKLQHKRDRDGVEIVWRSCRDRVEIAY
jgi:hypothetical protein